MWISALFLVLLLVLLSMLADLLDKITDDWMTASVEDLTGMLK